jgi:hypothetical protein
MTQHIENPLEEIGRSLPLIVLHCFQLPTQLNLLELYLTALYALLYLSLAD